MAFVLVATAHLPTPYSPPTVPHCKHWKQVGDLLEITH